MATSRISTLLHSLVKFLPDLFSVSPVPIESIQEHSVHRHAVSELIAVVTLLACDHVFASAQFVLLFLRERCLVCLCLRVFFA